MKTVLFLRKKIEGQNSMEELVSSLKQVIPYSEIVELPYYSTSFIGMIKNIIFAREKAGDVNHIFSITEAYLAPFIKGKKIVTVHDLYFKQLSLLGRIASRLLWIYLPSIFVHKYTCISNDTQKQLLNLIKWCRRKSNVIYNPVSDLFYEEYNKQRNIIPNILHIGTARHKNLNITIQAINGMRCHLTIVGKLFPEQLQLLKDYKIEYDNCYDISRKDLVSLYKHADVVSFPSRQEGFGMIVVEANAMKTPVIAGDIPVLHEIGSNGALYVTPGDVIQLRDAINSILSDITKRTNLTIEGSKNAQRFKLDSIANQYKNTYLC